MLPKMTRLRQAVALAGQTVQRLSGRLAQPQQAGQHALICLGRGGRGRAAGPVAAAQYLERWLHLRDQAAQRVFLSGEFDNEGHELVVIDADAWCGHGSTRQKRIGQLLVNAHRLVPCPPSRAHGTATCSAWDTIAQAGGSDPSTDPI